MTRTGGQGARRIAGTSGRKRYPGAAQEPRAPRAAWARILIALGKVGAVAAFAGVIVVGLLYVRLLHSPLQLDLLARQIERAISEEVSGVRVQIESAAVRLGEGGALGLELTNVRVTDVDEVPLAMAPSASLSLSRRGLMRGRIAPESLELISPRLLVFYGDDGKLSLKFSHPGEAANESSRPPPLRGSTAPVAMTGAESDGGLNRIDLIKVLSEASGRARRREHASSYLRAIGLRSATVIVDNGVRKSVWRVPELDVDLDHRRSRSSIAGRIKVESLAGPWTLNFRTYEHENDKSLKLAVTLQGLVPRGLARSLPQLAILEGIDVPVWGEAQLELSSDGEILSGTIGIDAAPGQVLLPGLAATPLRIDGGHFALSYSRAARRFEVAPSVLVWGDSRMQFTGNVSHTMQGPEGTGWTFAFKSAGG